jgi:hypothetical protein
VLSKNLPAESKDGEFFLVSYYQAESEEEKE